MHRPTGVTVLGWFAIAWGVFSILVGAFGVLLGLYVTAVGSVTLNSGLTAGANSFTLGVIVTVLSFLGAIVGVGDIVFGIGALRLSGWAWILGHLVMAASILVGATSAIATRSGVVGSLLGIAIAVGVIVYLHTREVLVAFGRDPAPAPDQPQAPTAS